MMLLIVIKVRQDPEYLDFISDEAKERTAQEVICFMYIDVTTVGGRIKKHRTDAGYTQEELAARLHLEGKSAICNYENNSRGVSAEMLTQLSRLFHVSADYILNGDSPDNLDPIVNEAIEILNNLKTDKAKKSALEMLRQIQILEG